MASHFFLADLHLRPDAPWLPKFTQQASIAIDTIYLGDTLERYAGVGMGDIVSASPNAYMTLLRAYEGGRIIQGNHDNDGCWPGAPFQIEFAPGCVALHGHQFDRLCEDGMADSITDWFGRTAWKMDRKGHFQTGTAMRFIRDINWLDRALKYVRERDIKILVCGHTHVSGIHVTEDGRTIAVCGGWPGGDGMGIRVEDGREVSLWHP